MQQENKLAICESEDCPALKVPGAKFCQVCLEAYEDLALDEEDYQSFCYGDDDENYEDDENMVDDN